MAELYAVTATNADIRQERQVLSYEYPDERPVEVIVRVDLGDNTKPIAGGGAYTLNAFIGDTLMTPSSSILVKAGVTKTVLCSRPIPLSQHDVLKIKIRGLSTDSSVNVKASVRDQTPLTLGDVVGLGTVSVDHDYGGPNALTVLDDTSGAPIDNAVILIFRKADYDSGLRSRDNAVTFTDTDVNGHWVHPAVLDPGQYILLVYKQGSHKAKAVPLTVS